MANPFLWAACPWQALRRLGVGFGSRWLPTKPFSFECQFQRQGGDAKAKTWPPSQRGRKRPTPLPRVSSEGGEGGRTPPSLSLVKTNARLILCRCLTKVPTPPQLVQAFLKKKPARGPCPAQRPASASCRSSAAPVASSAGTSPPAGVCSGPPSSRCHCHGIAAGDSGEWGGGSTTLGGSDEHFQVSSAFSFHHFKTLPGGWTSSRFEMQEGKFLSVLLRGAQAIIQPNPPNMTPPRALGR